MVRSAMPAYLRASLQTMFQYRGEIVLWAVWGVVYPVVTMVMWRAAAQDPLHGKDIRGYGQADFAAYFLLTMVVGHLSTAWDVYTMSYLIRSGDMSAKLLRPVLPVWESIADNLAYKVLTLVILVPIWLAIAYWTQPVFLTTTTQFLWAVPAVLLAVVLNFLVGYNLALLAFWFTRMDGIGELWFGLTMFFGGRLAPLTILPLALQHIASVLPFKWVIWFPSTALTGRLRTGEIAAGIGCQIIWIAISVVVFRRLWSAGVKQYSAVGA